MMEPFRRQTFSIYIIFLSFDLLLSSYNVSAAAGNSDGRFPYCPTPLSNLTLSWSSFRPHLWLGNSNASSNTTQPDGDLKKYIEESTQKCCPWINTTYLKSNITSSDEIEIAIRKHREPNLMLYFPVFANRNDKKHFDRPFIGLFKSPGMAVLEIASSEEMSDDSQAWGSMISALPYLAELALAGTISGIVMWMLVSIVHYIENR
jgi:hypothetical protein